MRQLPSFAAMVKAYPNQPQPEDVFKLIGGNVESNQFPNSCVVRISRALNYSGQPIHRSGQTLTVSGADHKWYAFRVVEFEGYMTREYGPPAISAHAPQDTGPVDRKPFFGKRGIIAFRVKGWSNATGHFDLWDGTRCVHEDYFGKANHVSLWLAPA